MRSVFSKKRNRASIAPGQRLRLARRRKKRIFGAFVVALIFGAIWGLREISYADELKIKDMVVSGSERVGEKWIAVDADLVMKEPLWKLFSRQNRFLVPESKIEKKILERPEIASVIADVNDGVLRIDVVERSSVILFCADFENCYEMDDRGMLFAKVDVDPTRIHIISNEPSKVILGAHPLDSKQIKLILDMIEAVKNVSLEVKEIRLDTNNELTFIPHFGAHIKTAWKTLSDAPNLLQTILVSEQVSTTTLISSEYIDLRFEGSVYYK